MKSLSVSWLSLVIGLALGIMVIWASAAPSITEGSFFHGTSGCYCVEKSTDCWDLDPDCSGTIDLCTWKSSGTWRTCKDEQIKTGCRGTNCSYEDKHSEYCSM